MQENKQLIADVGKYLEKRDKNNPTRLDTILRMYVKGELEKILERYPDCIKLNVNLANETLKSSEKVYMELCFKRGDFFAEIKLLDDYFEYRIYSDNTSKGNAVTDTASYSESQAFKNAVDLVWQILNDTATQAENQKQEALKREKLKNKRISMVFYIIACIIAAAVVIYNRAYETSKALWFLIIAIVPIVIGSIFKYKSLDR